MHRYSVVLSRETMTQTLTHTYLSKKFVQKLGADGAAGLVYGQSVTDACVSLEQTGHMFEVLAEAVRTRRGEAQK